MKRDNNLVEQKFIIWSNITVPEIKAYSLEAAQFTYSGSQKMYIITLVETKVTKMKYKRFLKEYETSIHRMKKPHHACYGVKWGKIPALWIIFL